MSEPRQLNVEIFESAIRNYERKREQYVRRMMGDVAYKQALEEEKQAVIRASMSTEALEPFDPTQLVPVDEAEFDINPFTRHMGTFILHVHTQIGHVGAYQFLDAGSSPQGYELSLTTNPLGLNYTGVTAFTRTSDNPKEVLLSKVVVAFPTRGEPDPIEATMNEETRILGQHHRLHVAPEYDDKVAVGEIAYRLFGASVYPE